MNSIKSYQPVVSDLLKQLRPRTILDAPCGSGWLRHLLTFDCSLDGIDLYATNPQGYRNFSCANLDEGLPTTDTAYDAIVCCEGIEHFRNPGLFFQSAGKQLSDGGVLIVTTPNTWYPESRLQYLLRGFFPSFPCLVGSIAPGSHMHVMPWSFPHLYLFLTMGGFTDVTLHNIDEPKPRHLYEWVLGLPQAMYCRAKAQKARTEEEQRFWAMSGSRQSVYGRRLVVSATAPQRSH